jgi:ABC-type transporter Mla subunit MlaD
LFNMLGLDPFSSLDPAVREITRSRQLAERTVYYAQHVPNLLDMQVERLTFELATMPETTQLLANADEVAGASSTSARVVSELPSFLTHEREAAIRQFMEAVTVGTAHTRRLVMELRAALESGTATSESLNSTIRSFDQLVARFDKPNVAGGRAQTRARPFDVTEYTAAAAEITRTAAELQTLIAGIDRDSPALGQAADRAAATLKGVVDHAYWRAAQLLALLIAGSLGAALTYRIIVRGW